MAASDQVDQCSSGWTYLAQNLGDPSREAVMKYALKIGFPCRQERKLALESLHWTFDYRVRNDFLSALAV